MKQKRARLLKLMLVAVEAEFAIAFAAFGRGSIPPEPSVGRERRFGRMIDGLPDQDVESLCALSDAQVEEFFRGHARAVAAKDLPS